MLLCLTPWRGIRRCCSFLPRCRKINIYVKKLKGLLTELLFRSKRNLRVIRESGGAVYESLTSEQVQTRFEILLSCRLLHRDLLKVCWVFYEHKSTAWRSRKSAGRDRERVWVVGWNRGEDGLQKKKSRVKAKKPAHTDDTILCLSLLTNSAYKINTRTSMRYYSCQINSHFLNLPC